jgi:hypothetical protein
VTVARSGLSLQASRQRAALLRAQLELLANQDDADLVARAGLTLASDTRRRARFLPSHVADAWLRLQASSQASGDWTSWTNITPGGTSAAPSDALRRPAVSASGSVPVAVFNGAVADTIAWPVSIATNNALKFGRWLRVKPNVTTGTQYVATMSIGTGGASANKYNIAILAGGILSVDLYFAGVARNCQSAAGAIVAGTAGAIGFTYDNSAGALDADKFKLIVGRAYVAGPTYSGAGVPGALPVPTGNEIIGNYQDSAAGAIPYSGVMGPNLLSLARGHLTSEQLANLDDFDRIT